MERVIDQRKIVIAGREESVQIAFVGNRKRISIRIDDAGAIQVRCPPDVPLKQVEALLHRETDWLDRRLADVRSKNLDRSRLGEGSPLPFLGDCLTLRLGNWGRGTVFRCGDDLWITGGNPGSPDLNLDILRPLERWYRRVAQAYFRRRLDHWSRIMETPYNDLHVRGQKTRWGSCSGRGNINLNWRLMWADPRVADYVVVHELSHRRHMNHSPAFWDLVRRHFPDFMECRGRLRNINSPW
ncbi:MAG: M48 family metallopeptidase [Magnetococcales bacterium]|nr:M48 family metallopeptidase [Magnetococcales bacterium]